MSRNADAMPGRTEKLIPLVRKSFGDEMVIHADSNSSYDPPKAIEVGRMLEASQMHPLRGRVLSTTLRTPSLSPTPSTFPSRSGDKI